MMGYAPLPILRLLITTWNTQIYMDIFTIENLLIAEGIGVIFALLVVFQLTIKRPHHDDQNNKRTRSSYYLLTHLTIAILGWPAFLSAFQGLLSIQFGIKTAGYGYFVLSVMLITCIVIGIRRINQLYDDYDVHSKALELISNTFFKFFGVCALCLLLVIIFNTSLKSTLFFCNACAYPAIAKLDAPASYVGDVKVRTKNGSYPYAQYTYTLQYIDINGQQHSSSYSLPYKNVPMPILLAEPTETIPIYINKWFADEYSLTKGQFSWSFLLGLVAVVIVLFGVIFLIGNIIYSVSDYKNNKGE
jgi:hypothetical protein